MHTEQPPLPRRAALLLAGVLATGIAGAAPAVGANGEPGSPAGAPSAAVADDLSELARWGGVDRTPLIVVASTVVDRPAARDEVTAPGQGTDPVAVARERLHGWVVRPAGDIRTAVETPVAPATPSAEADALDRGLLELRGWAAR